MLFVKSKVKWIWFLIAFELLYILSEFALNAALLNAGGGLVITREGIDDLEKAGRLLSGVGLGLLIFGLLSDNCSFRKRLLRFALTLGVSVPLMYAAQSFLIEDIIVANASPELKSRSQVLIKYKEGMVTGDYNIGNAFPVNQDNLIAPEALTLNSLYTVLLLDSKLTYTNLTQDPKSWLPSLVAARQEVKKEGMHEAYAKASERIESEWKSYHNGTMELLKVTPENAWNDVLKEAKKGYAEYKVARNEKLPIKIGNEFFKNRLSRKLEKQFDIAFNKPGCARRAGCQNIQFRKVESIMKAVTKRENNWRTWCDGNECPGSDLFLAKKVAHLYSDEFYAESGYSYHIDSLSEFMNQSKTKDKIFDLFAEKDIDLSSIKTLNRANFIKVYSKQAIEKFGGDVTGLRNGLTKQQFVNLGFIQSPFKTIMRGHYKANVPLGLTKEQFFVRYIKPKLNAEVDHEYLLIKNAVKEFAKNGSRFEEGNTYLKAVVVPPIALFFSLFFSLFALARLPLRFLEISQLKKSEPWKVKLKRILTTLDLCAILALPVLKSNSGFTSDEAMARFETLRGDALPPMQALGYKWVMGIEPIIYPVGMAILDAVDLNNIDHPMYD
ncbi:hypothetical protein LMH73_017870 [Vibrio splendidus]|nr:hypothetical protein [Vibrio splendidus]MCC4883088.1 hypothetical protein [Vibrio splendidus]